MQKLSLSHERHFSSAIALFRSSLAAHHDRPPPQTQNLSASAPLRLAGQEVALDSEHLGRNTSREAVNLPAVLLDLAAVQQRLETARLLRQLEQTLPLILRERSLLSSGAGGVLGFALLLPGGDLGLLAAERALVVLVVVELGVVVLDAVEQQVARLLQERVDGQVERVEVGAQRRLRLERVRVERRQVGREGQLVLGRLRGQLVQQRGEEVRVVDGEGQLDEDVVVAEAALLKACGESAVWFAGARRSRVLWDIPLGGELALLVGGHELGGQAEGAQAEGTLGAAADVVDEGDGTLVHLLLVEELVLDGVEVDEVAHAGAGVPADILGVNVDLAQELDHLVLVGDIGLGARSGGSGALLGIMRALGGHVDGGEGEAVGDLQRAVDVHADDGTGGGGGEGLGAVLDDLHDHKGLDLDRTERRILEKIGHGVLGGVGGRLPVSRWLWCRARRPVGQKFVVRPARTAHRAPPRLHGLGAPTNAAHRHARPFVLEGWSAFIRVTSNNEHNDEAVD